MMPCFTSILPLPVRKIIAYATLAEIYFEHLALHQKATNLRQINRGCVWQMSLNWAVLLGAFIGSGVSLASVVIIQQAYGFVRGKKSLDGRALKSVSSNPYRCGHDVARTVGWAVD